MESSWTRDRTHVPCISRRILWTIREAPSLPCFFDGIGGIAGRFKVWQCRSPLQQPQAGHQMCLPSNRESNRACCRRFVKWRKISGQKLSMIPLWLVFDSFLFGLFFCSASLMWAYFRKQNQDCIEYIVYILNKEVCGFLYQCKHFSMSLTASNTLFCKIVQWRVK